MAAGKPSISQRVAILAPTGKDADLVRAALVQVAIGSVVCTDLAGIEQAIAAGADLLLIAEEAITNASLSKLTELLSHQPPWSDLPVLLLARYGADSSTIAVALPALGNVTLLERPVRPATLISAVQANLKARDRQHQVARHLEELAATNASLQESIQQRARVEEALRDADRRKDEFIATLAHELRNPLAPIRNSLHILRMSRDDAAAEQLCEMMERQVSHLVRLVDDLLEVSRITRGKVELRAEPIEIAAVVRSAVETSRPLIDAAHHQLAIALPPEPLIVEGDPVRLTQIVANLLNNAAKYMENGGQIWLSIKPVADEVQISVRDSGVGIAADMLPHIFNMFTQVDRSTRQAQGGLGIGLTLVRSLVEMHGGLVTAHSAGVGQGSDFIVRLPLGKNTSGIARRAAPTTASVLPNHRVLVVDDNVDSAKSLGLLLKKLGAEVQVVHDGPSALDLLAHYHPTVVLLDIGMPGMDGYEVARRIRSQPNGDQLLLIALTGWGQEDDRLRSRQAGFDHHLLKPADLSALKAIVALPASDPRQASR